MRKIDLQNFQVATSETAREINRRIVLNFLRTHQPISRADLARKSGLQFSTVSLIIEELIKQQWVTEGELTDVPRGRKPRVLHFNHARTRMLAVDIRPTYTTYALADLSGNFMDQERIRTNADPRKFAGELSQKLSQFVKAHPYNYAGVGVSLPGRTTRSAARLAYAPNLGWRDVDLITPLTKATGAPVLLENAPNACALAEIWFGQHSEGVQDLVVVTVSEGVGAGIFMNGQLLRGPTGQAGEFGHVSIQDKGPKCICGNQGCWESFASNTATLRHYRELAGARAKRVKGVDELVGLSDQGDKAARKALERMGYYLGVGMAMIITSLAPTVIVIVGEVNQAWHLVGPQIEQQVRIRCQPHLPTRVVPTDDLVHPRLRGAAAVVLHNQLGAPLLA